MSRMRVVAWAVRAAVGTRRHVRHHGLRGLAVPPAPVVAGCERTVEVVLARLRVRCLVRSLVMQRFLFDQGEAYPLLVGATSPRRGFSAHAWLDRPGESDKGHVELLRLPAPAR